MASTWIDQKYVGMISNRLEQFKQKDRELYNFRCPICGDSQKSRTKARGWIFSKKGKLRFYCHNCGQSMLFGNFLKTIDIILHQEYLKEVFIENNVYNPIPEPAVDICKIQIPKYKKESPLKNLTKVSSLPVDHYAKKYIMSRKIPSHIHYKLFFAPKFKTWVNSFIPDKFKDLNKDEPRLIIPFIDRDKNFFGCQGRALIATKQRYITIIADEDKPKVYGLDATDLSKHVYVFEGPIDSMFIENSIAMCGADLSQSIDINKSNSTIVFDNEPRSLQIVKKIDKYARLGYRVCLWPDRMNGKDVNEMILNGHDSDEIKIIIDKNSYSDLEANLQLQMWRKC
jgi:predicted RNA-binding Zn-ribbon protein involved in translation (DUF1610 family)